MPLLGALLVSLFGGFAGWLTQWMTKKTAFGVAAVTTFALLTGGLLAGLQFLLNALAMTFPVAGPVVETFLWVALPPAVPAAVSIGISADAAIALYRWNVENLRLVSFVT